MTGPTRYEKKQVTAPIVYSSPTGEVSHFLGQSPQRLVSLARA
jgi:hypothetical protein